MIDSKIGNAQLTGEAEGVEQKLHLDVTEIINKVILKLKFYKRKYFTHIPGLFTFLKDLTAVRIELTVIDISIKLVVF